MIQVKICGITNKEEIEYLEEVYVPHNIMGHQ